MAVKRTDSVERECDVDAAWSRAGSGVKAANAAVWTLVIRCLCKGCRDKRCNR
jgi:hypothetical protein